MSDRLDRNFYEQDTLNVATQLLGKILVCKQKKTYLRAMILETEAYHQKGDPASHSFHGQTKRNEVMFWNGGYLYVYFIYGMHYCMNVVTEKEGIGSAVLIRSLQNCTQNCNNIEKNTKNSLLDTSLKGPAKICKALDISNKQNGLSLINSMDMWIEDAPPLSPENITSSSRIGISKAKDHKWRFFITFNPYVSA